MKNYKLGLLILMVLMIAFSACAKKDVTETDAEATKPVTTQTTIVSQPETQPETQPEPEPEVDPYEGMLISPITGNYVEEEVALRRPFAVTISNIKEALPQSGISEAEVIYETLAEGGIPRLVAVFQDFEGEKIGPVRSARHYFIDFAFDFDGFYVHYGKSPQAQDAFRALNAPHIDGMSYAMMSYQDPNRRRPHASFTTKDMLIATSEYLNYRTERSEEIPHKFDFSEDTYTIDSSDTIANIVKLPYSYYITSTFKYNEEDKAYYHFQYGKEHIDIENEQQLKFDNIIIQLTNIWAIKGDTAGRLDMELIGSGNGYYVTNGKSEKITWKKTSHNDPTKYFHEDGQPLLINKGKTWISVFPTYNEQKIEFLDKE